MIFLATDRTPRRSRQVMVTPGPRKKEVHLTSAPEP